MKGIPGFVVHLEVRRHRLQDVHHITPHSLQGETTPQGELHTDIQGETLPLGTARRALGQLQARPDPGNCPQETLPPGGDDIQEIDGG